MCIMEISTIAHLQGPVDITIQEMLPLRIMEFQVMEMVTVTAGVMVMETAMETVMAEAMVMGTVVETEMETAMAVEMETVTAVQRLRSVTCLLEILETRTRLR